MVCFVDVFGVLVGGFLVVFGCCLIDFVVVFEGDYVVVDCVYDVFVIEVEDECFV